MAISSSQQVLISFTAVLFAFVILPKMFGVGNNVALKETRGLDSRYNRKVGPGAVRAKPVSMNTPGSAQTLENMQQMKMMMEQEMKSDKYKPNINKGYVFTLMPLYAVGVGVFAAYKFLKIKFSDDSQVQKNKAVKGAKKSVETENQLNELEQRLAQTEKVLNTILTQLDPLTNCIKSVAQEQKNEIMSQLQTIRCLMRKRGMDYPHFNIEGPSYATSIDDFVESLAAQDTMVAEDSVAENHIGKHGAEGYEETQHQKGPTKDDNAEGQKEEEFVRETDTLPLLEDSCGANIEGPTLQLQEERPGLRRRNRPN